MLRPYAMQGDCRRGEGGSQEREGGKEGVIVVTRQPRKWHQETRRAGCSPCFFNRLQDVAFPFFLGNHHRCHCAENQGPRNKHEYDEHTDSANGCTHV